FTGPLYTEALALASYYEKPKAGGSVDFSTGYLIHKRFGIGADLQESAHRGTAGLGIVVPHPYYFNASGVGGGVTQTLTRMETALNLAGAFVPVNEDRAMVRLFAGPSYFRYSADMVQDVAYSQVASSSSRSNTVRVTGSELATGEGSGWGFN